ncbi:MAG: hypothetical protein JWM10_3001 [Myxococcaceae bacterium]|nr:hypothetical protein [Myxococcaceae bacterium]
MTARWAIVGALGMVLGCGTATDVAGGDAGAADAGPVDTGLSLEDAQFEAANSLGNEMAQGVREMQLHYSEAARPAFMSGLAAWNTAGEHGREVARADAGLGERRAAIVMVRIGEAFPAYCDMRAAMPDVTPTVVPRIACSEQPVTLALLVERYP